MSMKVGSPDTTWQPEIWESCPVTFVQCLQVCYNYCQVSFSILQRLIMHRQATIVNLFKTPYSAWPAQAIIVMQCLRWCWATLLFSIWNQECGTISYTVNDDLLLAAKERDQTGASVSAHVQTFVLCTLSRVSQQQHSLQQSGTQACWDNTTFDVYLKTTAPHNSLLSQAQKENKN